MKISVSVPDELWSDVAAGTESPSQVVQDALRLLQTQRRSGEARLTDFETRLDAHVGTGGEAPGSGWTRPVLDKLTAEATTMRTNGYRMAVNVAEAVEWWELEALPTGTRLRDLLLQWASGDDTAISIGNPIYRVLSEWEIGLDENQEPVPSATLYEGMASGLDDLRSAVRERTRSQGDLGSAG